MRRFLIGLAVAASAMSFAAHAMGPFDVPEGSAGSVEHVREVPLLRDPHAFDEVLLEHRVRPETAEELAIRLDSGALMFLTRREHTFLQPGERVRVLLNGGVTRVERVLD